MSGADAAVAVRGRIAVVGAGTMGGGIATVAVQAGFRTTLVDVNPTVLDAAGEAIRRRLERLQTDHPNEAQTVGQLQLSTDLSTAVADATAVIEAVPEVEQLKLDVLTRIASATDADCLLATNTSTLSVSRMAEACGGSHRVIGMHFFNPAHRMALVEVVVGQRSSRQTVDDAEALAVSLGKKPIVVGDVPGFVTSRLGLLLGNEAMGLVEAGVATSADVDKAMRLGYGHPMGPLELADLVGLDARLNNLRSMYRRSGLEQYRAPAILERLVVAGRLGRKSGAGFYVYDQHGCTLGPAQMPQT